MLSELSQQQTAKLVLLGEMGSGKSSLVLRYVKGQFFDYQVRHLCAPLSRNLLISNTTSYGVNKRQWTSFITSPL